MDEIIQELIEKFEKISNLGWVKSNRSHNTGIGKTFEDLLDKPEDNLGDPDYKGIEIKTKRQLSSSYTTLITKSPVGNGVSQNSRLKETYGHIDENGKKSLHTSYFANKLNTYFNTYRFKVEVDRIEQKIYTLIYDINGNLIERIAYWDFDVLEKKLEKKLKTMALIFADSKVENGLEYFKYNAIKIYDYIDFEKFLLAVDNGIIMADIRIGYYKSGKSIGKAHDHGTGFRIKPIDLLQVFTLIAEKGID